MDALTRGAVLALLLLELTGCAVTPPAEPLAGGVDETPWGDEYTGVGDDADMEAVLAGTATRSRGGAAASFHALFEPSDDVSPLRSFTANGRVPHAAANYRRAGSGDAGAVELFDVGPFAHVVAGAIRPRVGEGAWLADARELGTPVAPGASSVGALRVAPSSLRWGSVLGAGAAVDAKRLRVSAAAWRPHDDDTTWTAWSGVEWRFARTVAGVAAGKTARSRPVVSLIVARAVRSAFVCMETATTGIGMVFAARAVSGNSWRAALASGAAVPPQARPGGFARDRRMGVVERRDDWRGMSSRVIASSAMQREGPEHERQRRVDWRVGWPLDSGARIEGGVRFRERVAIMAPSLLAPGEESTSEEWRARLALFVRDRPSPVLEVEHMFRIDAVHAGSAPGFGGTWRGIIRRGAFDLRAQASAWGLRPGQTAYLRRGGLPGSGAFTSASGSGSDLSAAARARAWGHAAVAAEWRREASGDDAVRVGISLDW